MVFTIFFQREKASKDSAGTGLGLPYARNLANMHNGKLYLDCYSAFGGINGSWGAKNEYTIQLDEDTEMIALFRSPNCYDPVLEKDANGEWQRVTQ